MASGSMAMLRRAAQDCLRQASAEHFQQCAEFLPLRNRGQQRGSVCPRLARPGAARENRRVEVCALRRDDCSCALRAAAVKPGRI